MDIQRRVAIGLLDQGVPIHNIAVRFACDETTIRRLRQRFEETVSTADRPRPGRPRVTSIRQDRAIIRAHIQDRFASAWQRTLFRPPSGIVYVSEGCEQECHTGAILVSRTEDWAKLHQRFALAWWRSVLFSDESRVCVDRRLHTRLPSGRWQTRVETTGRYN